MIKKRNFKQEADLLTVIFNVIDTARYMCLEKNKSNLNGISNVSYYWQKDALILLLFTFLKAHDSLLSLVNAYTSFHWVENEVIAFKNFSLC